MKIGGGANVSNYGFIDLRIYRLGLRQFKDLKI
jgi:multisubunit Na+/H+ antiporter MnhB subunit